MGNDVPQTRSDNQQADIDPPQIGRDEHETDHHDPQTPTPNVTRSPRRMRSAAVVGVVVVVLSVGAIALAQQDDDWRSQWREIVQQEIIDQPDFQESCGISPLLGVNVYDFVLGVLSDSQRENAAEAADIARGMIEEACAS